MTAMPSPVAESQASTPVAAPVLPDKPIVLPDAPVVIVPEVAVPAAVESSSPNTNPSTRSTTSNSSQSSTRANRATNTTSARVSSSTRPAVSAVPADTAAAAGGASAPTAGDMRTTDLSPEELAAIPPAASEPVQTTGPSEEPGSPLPEGALLALLGLLGIGAAGGLFALTRRRKPEVDVTYDVAPVTARVEPLREPAPLAVEPAPVASAMPMEPTRSQPVRASFAPADYYTGDAMPGEAGWRPRNAVQEAAAAMMADGPPPVGRERADLLRAMTSASPDRFNPFTSPKARRRRARLILQYRETLWEARVAQPFDWRTYEPSSKRVASQPVEYVSAR